MKPDINTLKMVRGHIRQMRENGGDDMFISSAILIVIGKLEEWVTELIEATEAYSEPKSPQQ